MPTDQNKTMTINPLNPELISFKEKTEFLQVLQLKAQNFRGCLILEGKNGVSWKFYFRLGRLSWVTGGFNACERLQRNLALFCPEINQEKFEEISAKCQLDGEAAILVHLQGQKLIERQQIASLMTNIAVEVLFDALQYSENNAESLSCRQVTQDSGNKLSLLLPFLEVELILAQAQQAWQDWQNAGLKVYSPNLYPVIKQLALLKKQVTEKSEQQVMRLVDGTQTLRQIAFKSKKDLLSLTHLLLPFVKSGAIEFSPVPSLEKIELNFINSASSPNKKRSTSTTSEKSPLIVCVDDSPLICKAIENIILSQDYRFISIQEPIKVVPTLLKNKPDFIFLDLLMPVINGYELCSQLRKTPSLKDIPIVIVTGNDGLVDRMRAKLVGSTDFISKPVESEKILNILKKHLVVRSAK